jgi:hypothetical protein
MLWETQSSSITSKVVLFTLLHNSFIFRPSHIKKQEKLNKVNS